MIEIPYIYQGEDFPMSVELFNDDGTPVNLDELTDIIMYVCLLDEIVFSCRKSDGDHQWQKISDTEYRVVVDSSVTKTWRPGKYSAEINFVFPSPIVVDGRLNRIVKDEVAFIVKKSLVGRES